VKARKQIKVFLFISEQRVVLKLQLFILQQILTLMDSLE